MKTITKNQAERNNQQSDEIQVGHFAVLDTGNCGVVLAVRQTVEAAHSAACEIETEFDRETEVVEMVI